MTRTHDEHDPYENVEWIARDADGRIQRRTIVQGAAWTIPVVAIAATAPAAAASTTPVNPRVEFLANAYSADPCAQLTGVRVRAFDGTATVPAGTGITVSLPLGFKFADGTRRKVVVTNSSGVATLPPITVTAPDSTRNFTAAYGSATDTAAVTTDSTARGFWGRMDGSGSFTRFPNVPVKSNPLGYNYFVGPGGALWYNNETVAGAGNVQGAGGGAWQTSTPANHASVLLGSAWYDVNSGTRGSTALTGVPSDYTSVGNGYFRSPGGNPDLIYRPQGSPASELLVNGAATKVQAYDISSDGNVVTYQANVAGVDRWYRVVNGNFANATALPTSIPLDAANLGYDFFQSGSTIYYRDGSVFAINAAPPGASYSGVKTFMGTNNTPRINWRDSNGVWHSGKMGEPRQGSYPNVPGTATPLGYNYFLDEEGNLWYGNSIIQSGVAAATVAFSGLNDTNLVNVRLRDCP